MRPTPDIQEETGASGAACGGGESRLGWDNNGAYSPTVLDFWVPSLCVSLASAVEVLCSPTCLATPYTFSIHLSQVSWQHHSLGAGALAGASL